MSYTLNRLLPDTDMATAEERTRAALTDKGFGVLTEIDVKATIKTKIDKDMPGYKILGACNPNMAYQAIGLEPRLGAMLPCNVILREVDGGIEVSAIDPIGSEEEGLALLATAAINKLKKAEREARFLQGQLDYLKQVHESMDRNERPHSEV